MSLVNSSLRAGACLLLAAFAGAAVAGPVTLNLLEKVVVAHPVIVLGDLIAPASLPSHQLAAFEVAHAPRVGYALRFTKDELDNQVRRHFPAAAIAWDGAAVVVVRTEAQAVDVKRMREAALAQVRADYPEPGTAVEIETPSAALDIPAGPYTLRARALPAGAPAARLPVWVDVLVEGTVYRSVVLVAAVSLEGAALVARRPLEAGNRIALEDFTVSRVNVAGLHPLSVDEFGKGGARLRMALRPGQVLNSEAMAPAGAIFHGDQVRVSVQGGAVGVEALAVAQGPALPGQIVSLRASSSGETLRGRVTRAGNVVIE